MKFLLAIMSVGSALGYSVSYNPYGSYSPYQQTSNFPDNSYDGLLVGASPQAVAAYNQIVQNLSQPLTDIRTALEKWAKTYGLEQQYKKFVADSEKESSDFKKEVNNLLPKLSQYFTQYMKIADDKRQLVSSIFEKTTALSKTLDDKQRTIVEFITNTYMPSTADAVPRNQGNNNAVYVGNNGPFPGNGGFQGGPQIYPNNGFYPGGNAGFTGISAGFPQTNGGLSGRNNGFLGITGNLPRNNGLSGFNPSGNNGNFGSNGGYTNNGGLPGYNGGYPRTTTGNNRNNEVFTGINGNYPNGNRGNAVGGFMDSYQGNGNRLQNQNGGIYGSNGGIPNSNGGSQNSVFPRLPSFGSIVSLENQQIRP